MMMMFQDHDLIGMAPSAIDDISSPIAAHILDFCDDGNGGDLFPEVNAAAADMFTASSEDVSASSSSTAPNCSAGDNFSPLPSLDSTLSALLEQDDPLLPIEDYNFAAVVDETQATEQQQQQFGGQMPPLPMVNAGEHPALQTQLSSTASELMQFATGFNDESFVTALAAGAAGVYMGLDEPIYPQQHHPGAAMLPAGAGEVGFFANGGVGGGSSCTGAMVMSMMTMDEIGEYQRMMECGGAALLAADGAEMGFGNAAAAAEMQMAGSGSPVRMPATGTTETSSLEDTSFKAVRLSNEERKEKIDRYIKKRSERNFSKKIKVSTLAEKPSQTAGLASVAGSPRTTTTARHRGQSARRITKTMNRLAA